MKTALALAGALAAGVVAAAAVTTASTANTVCATTPAHTVAVDGSGVSTTPQDVECVTVPTETVTVTAQQTTTAPSTTSYDQAISYTQTRPAFTPTRTVNVSGEASLKAAITNLQAGDLVKASAPFTVSTSTCLDINIASKNFSTWAVIDLTGVTINYTGTSNCPGVALRADSHLRLYGGDISTGQGGDCINDHGSNNVLWWGFNVHDCGGQGVAILAASDGGGAPDHLDWQGTVSSVGQNLNRDPHLEKRTGLHGVILWDGSAGLPFTNNRLAFDVNNITVGACVELGQTGGSSAPSSGNTLYVRCNGNPCVATSQTCGNGLQLWGGTSNLSLDVKYLEVDNYAGEPVYGQSIASGQNATSVTVEYGRATNDQANPYPKNLPLWDNHGEVYQDVQPAP